MINELKQVIVVRKDLGLPKGKLCVQVAHAAVTAYIEARKKNPEWANKWLLEGQKKIVVVVKDLDELLRIYEEASKSDIPVALIRDAGLTTVPPGTITCVGIGPAPACIIDRITGKLKLL